MYSFWLTADEINIYKIWINSKCTLSIPFFWYYVKFLLIPLKNCQWGILKYLLYPMYLYYKIFHLLILISVVDTLSITHFFLLLSFFFLIYVSMGTGNFGSLCQLGVNQRWGLSFCLAVSRHFLNKKSIPLFTPIDIN